MYPLFRLVGIDTVTPETEVQSDGNGIPVVIPGLGDTGLTVGGANLIPIKLDIGIQNFPASDFAAWPNPVTLANNAAALMFPTYILRGADLTNISTVLAGQILQINFPALAQRRPRARSELLSHRSGQGRSCLGADVSVGRRDQPSHRAAVQQPDRDGPQPLPEKRRQSGLHRRRTCEMLDDGMAVCPHLR